MMLWYVWEIAAVVDASEYKREEKEWTTKTKKKQRQTIDVNEQ